MAVTATESEPSSPTQVVPVNNLLNQGLWVILEETRYLDLEGVAQVFTRSDDQPSDDEMRLEATRDQLLRFLRITGNNFSVRPEGNRILYPEHVIRDFLNWIGKNPNPLFPYRVSVS